jgi:hypothetical protein
MEYTSNPHARVPWNKGKLVGQKAPSSPRRSGRSGRACKSRTVPANWRCSTWASTASCAPAIW